MIRVYFADDSPLILEGLHSLLSMEKDIKLAGQSRNGESCLAFLLKHPADVVLLDTTLPDISGMDLCAAIKIKYPETKVLGLSFLRERKYITGMLESGASGFVLKNADKEELVHAIHAVHSGEIYLSDEVEKAMEQEDRFGRNRLSHLTKREKEVLLLIAEGNTNQEIAERLYISAATVDSHRRNLLSKLRARNTAMLIKYAVENKLLA